MRGMRLSTGSQLSMKLPYLTIIWNNSTTPTVRFHLNFFFDIVSVSILLVCEDEGSIVIMNFDELTKKNNDLTSQLNDQNVIINELTVRDNDQKNEINVLKAEVESSKLQNASLKQDLENANKRNLMLQDYLVAANETIPEDLYIEKVNVFQTKNTILVPQLFYVRTMFYRLKTSCVSLRF